MSFETPKSTTAATDILSIIKFVSDWKIGINLGFWDRYTVSITTGPGTSFGGNTKPGYRRIKMAPTRNFRCPYLYFGIDSNKTWNGPFLLRH
jgi:hypothetical protein